jgi:hypothetical protein
MPIVLAMPAAVPEPIVLPEPLRMVWTGFDGSVWPLTRPDAVNPRMRRGVKGLHLPPVDVFQESTPLVPGVDILGYSLPGRSVYWPLQFRARSREQWEIEHAAFFDSFHPVQTGEWAVGDGDKRRTLRLTGVFDGDYSFDRDPFLGGLAVIGIELFAPRPLWRGKEIKKTFGGDEGIDFIPAEPGDDYYPSPTATFSQASIENPGNEPAYVTWVATGPLTGLQMGVGDALIEVPFDVAEGETLTIDTDPANQYATLNGEDVTRELGFQLFAPVPARGTTPLTITASPTGTVEAKLTPLYWRAF